MLIKLHFLDPLFLFPKTKYYNKNKLSYQSTERIFNAWFLFSRRFQHSTSSSGNFGQVDSITKYIFKIYLKHPLLSSHAK